MNIKDKTIAITGGSGGIGALLSEKLLSEGAKVLVLDLIEPKNKSCGFVKADLSNIEGIKAAGEELAGKNIDILINLAGIQYFGEMELEAPTHVQLLYNINLLAPVVLTQSVLPSMKEKKCGKIVNIGSTFGSINFAHFVTYSSSKAGLRGFSEALRRELKDSGVSVTYVAPRAVKTPLNTDLVLKLAKQINMNMDEPSLVADIIVRAIIKDKKDVFIGFPEKLFVRINAILPRVVDNALYKNDMLAKKLLQGEKK